MTDETTAPEGGEGNSAPVTVITPAADTGDNLSISQAARALAQARHQPKEQPVESADPATAEDELAQANAEPAEEQPIGEDATDIDPAETPPIEPPRSWTKEAKERWQSLPRETQEYLSTREQERDREVRRSQNETAEKLKGLTAKEQQVEQARQQYEAKLPALMQALQDAQAESFSDIRTMDDVKRMAVEDPFRKIQWDTHQQMLQAVAQEQQQADQRKAQDKQSKRSTYEAQENVRLIELVPEMADPKKAGELRSRAIAMLTDDLGLKTDQLSQWMQDDTGHEILSNAGIQKLIADGLKYRDIQKAKTAAVAKPVPQVQRPGVSRPASASASEQIQALTQKLERSGSLKDAQALRAAQARVASRRAS